jgi:DHA2 family multidrug resistance protein
MPLLVQSEFGYDATTAGLVLSPGGFAVIIFMPLAGRLINKVQARYLIGFGMFLSSLGMFYSMLVTPETDYNTFVMMRILQVAGLPFLFVPISAVAFLNIPKEKTSKASALYSLMRNLGGGIGISVLASYVTRHEQMHQTFLAAHLVPQDTVYQATLAGYVQALFSQGYTMVQATAGATAKMYQELLSQAAILAYADAFQAVAVVMAVLSIVPVFFMPRNRPGRKPNTDAAAVAH